MGLESSINNVKAQGLLKPCDSPCNSPILGVQKPNGKQRLFQNLNLRIIKLQKILCESLTK